jgi:glycosyltransferase involved in cell wall biosynthesis
MVDQARAPVTIAIPTYRREQVLLETIHSLLALPTVAVEILVLDQTEQHEPATLQALDTLHRDHSIRWLRLSPPSIPCAMNTGLLEASQPLVLFVDDDIRPEPELVSAHVAAHAAHAGGLVAGRVIQPWEEGVDLSGLDSFARTRSGTIDEFIGCNFSVRRDLALQLGGFDENFVRVAYRFEAEFAHRYRRQGLAIHFEPGACVHHLKVTGGGTRTFGEHLLTYRPDHSVGAYYYGLRTRTLREFMMRPIRAVATRYHLRHPWRIPASLVAELGGMLWAMGLYLRGPKYVRGGKRDIS